MNRFAVFGEASKRRFWPRWKAATPCLDGSSHSLGAQSRVRDRPRLRRAHDPRVYGPYFALGRDLATWIRAPSLWRAVPYFALVRPSWLVPYPGPGAWLVPYPRARSLDLALRGRDLPFYDGRVISLRVRHSGPRGQACPSALSASLAW